jgi:hypothetical protein
MHMYHPNNVFDLLDESCKEMKFIFILPDQTRQDKTGLDKTRPDRTRQDWTGLDKTRPDRTRQDRTGLDKTGPD